MISPKLARLLNYLPRGLVNYGSKKVLDFIIKTRANLKINGLENLKNLPKPVIFISNHLSNSDALILNKILKDIDVTFVAGIKLSQNATTNLGINIVKTTSLKPNSADKEGISRIIGIVKNGGSILIFPEGTRSRTGKMIEAKKGLLLIAKLTNTPIVPIGIYGTEDFMPINEEGDMASEKFYHADVTVSIGRPMKLPSKMTGEEKLSYEERALSTMMRGIAELIPEKYRGIYS